MPGIFGLSNSKVNIQKQLNRMSELLTSDWTKINEKWVDPSNEFGLGRVGLGIFQPDRQPFINNNRVIFMEGEIVNQKELIERLGKLNFDKKLLTDAELVLLLFEKEGLETFKLLNGSFAIVIWEINTQKLILVSDYAGLRPIFYFHQGKQFCFASEIKAILSLNWNSPKVDHRAMIDFLAFGYPQGDLTLFENIFRIQPGTILIYQNGHVELKEFFQIRYHPQVSNKSDREHQEEVSMLLENSLLVRCKPELRVGLTLSGGLDTRLLLAICNHLNLRLPTYTYGSNNSGDQQRAKKLARIVGFPHFSYELEQDYVKQNASFIVERCEGRVDCFLSQGLLLNKMKESSHVMLLGNGGDYLFSVSRDHYPKSLEIIPDQPYETYYRFRNSFFKEVDWANVLQDKLFRLKDRPREKLFELLDKFDSQNIDHAIDAYAFNIIQMNRTLQGLYMVNHIMEFSEPYFDKDLVLCAMSLPFHLRRKRTMHNLLLEQYNSQLASIEGGSLYQESSMHKFIGRNSRRVIRRLVNYKLLDKKFISRPASTFSDLHYLIRKSPNKEWVTGELINKNARIYEYVKPDYINRIVNQHMADIENHTKQINTLMTLELFLQQYIP